MKGSDIGKGRWMRFLWNNRMYVALSALLLAVGAFGVVRVLNTTSQDVEKKPLTDEMVEQTVTGEPDTRSTTTTSKVTTSTTTSRKTEVEEEEAPELYVFPVSNTVQKAFSATEPVYCDTTQCWKLHLGTDFAGEKGQKVKSLARGTVAKIESDPLWGDVIVIDHSVGVESRYCGVKATVREGDQVGVGDVIGTLDEIPCEVAQSAHLHLEMTIDETAVDPVEVIGKEVRNGEMLDE